MTKLLAAGDRAPDVTLSDQDNHPIAFSALWHQQATAFVFLRHFGCMHCRAQAVELQRARERLDRAGLQVILIGQGTPAEARAFRSQFDLSFRVLCDQKRLSYRAYGLLHMNVLRELAPNNLQQTVVRARAFGAAASWTQDMTQNGGVFIVDRLGMLCYAAPSLRASSYPDVETLIAAVDGH